MGKKGVHTNCTATSHWKACVKSEKCKFKNMKAHRSNKTDPVRRKKENTTSLIFCFEEPFSTVEELCCLITSSIDDPFSCTNLTDSDSLFNRLNKAMTSFLCSCS
jgi:hypothetical protein